MRTRAINTQALLLSFYTLAPPQRLETVHLTIIKDESEALDNDASILIKDSKNIFLYYNEEKKLHKPIKLNLGDPVLKQFSKDNINTLISNIIESVELYPRKYLFINSKNEPYQEKSVQKNVL